LRASLTNLCLGGAHNLSRRQVSNGAEATAKYGRTQ
jgi:hypothetical protein